MTKRKIKDHELVSLLGGRTRCMVLDSSGIRCKKLAKYRGCYHGENEIYSSLEDNEVSWVQIEVCDFHALGAFRYEKLTDLPIIITPK